MQHYEATIMLRGDDDAASVTDLISKLGGQITKEENLGRRRLAYPIKKESSAVFGVWQFEAEPDKILELNKKLTGQEQVLRHLIIAGGIRRPTAPVKKLSAKDLEVPESLTKGMAELAKAAAIPTLEEVGTPPVPTETSGIASVGEATAAEAIVVEKPTKAKKAAKKVPAARSAEEVTAEERQKKLDEKLKSILGE